jgi:hypothetical protein
VRAARDEGVAEIIPEVVRGEEEEDRDRCEERTSERIVEKAPRVVSRWRAVR